MIEVMDHQADGAIRVSTCDGFDQRAVLIFRAQRYVVAPEQSDDQRTARNELFDKSRQDRTSAELGQSNMKSPRKPNGFVPFAGFAGREFLVNVMPKRCNLRILDPLDRVLDDDGLNRAPSSKHVLCLFRRRTGDEGTTIGLKYDDFTLSQHDKRPPDARTARAERLAQNILR